jgi:competence protein CoiA
MQRWAFSDGGEQIFAEKALPQVDYVCPECFSAVRVRRGEERVPHFFHVRTLRSCRLHHRERVHLAVQDWLVRELGEQNCSIECFFPEIQRVADVAYHPKKIVFEVQVSPMDEKTALARTEGYYRIGWHVIWLLHVERFGKVSAEPFERLLYTVPHYFTDIDARGGKIWDEVSAVIGTRRKWYSWPPSRRYFSSIQVHVTHCPSRKIERLVPSGTNLGWYKDRKKTWSCHIENDFLSESPPTEKKDRLGHMKSCLQRMKVHLHLAWLRLIGG